MNYLKTTQEVYKKAAESPEVGLCCTTTPVWQFQELTMPKIMLEMNYGCGSTVHPRDLINQPTILYVGVGGGMELLQFSFFFFFLGAVVGVDVVDEMLHACTQNFEEAAQVNPWFDPSFVTLKKGDALSLPVADAAVDVAAQNCLFNIFKKEALKTALHEIYRVLKPGGRLVLSDPICEQEMPLALQEDATLRALCLSGAIPLNDYVELFTEVGFGTIEIRARRPYRMLSPKQYPIEELLYIESVEVCAIKDPMPADGPCVFTGKSALYYGKEDFFDDQNGHVLLQNQPLAVCDKTAAALHTLNPNEIFISPATFHYDGGGCC